MRVRERLKTREGVRVRERLKTREGVREGGGGGGGGGGGDEMKGVTKRMMCPPM